MTTFKSNIAEEIKAIASLNGGYGNLLSSAVGNYTSRKKSRSAKSNFSQLTSHINYEGDVKRKIIGAKTRHSVDYRQQVVNPYRDPKPQTKTTVIIKRKSTLTTA